VRRISASSRTKLRRRTTQRISRRHQVDTDLIQPAPRSVGHRPISSHYGSRLDLALCSFFPHHKCYVSPRLGSEGISLPSISISLLAPNTRKLPAWLHTGSRLPRLASPRLSTPGPRSPPCPISRTSRSLRLRRCSSRSPTSHILSKVHHTFPFCPLTPCFPCTTFSPLDPSLLSARLIHLLIHLRVQRSTTPHHTTPRHTTPHSTSHIRSARVADRSSLNAHSHMDSQ
jgi:hypothetical protein